MHQQKQQPSVAANANKQSDNDNGIHPLYPTADGRPPKGFEGVKPLDKPQKKPTKGDKYAGPGANGGHTKYEFANYDDDDEEDIGLGPQHRPGNPSTVQQQSNGNPGPGFFNPAVSKNQYPDYDHAIFHNGQQQQHQRPQLNQPSKPGAFNPFVVHQPIGGGNGADDQDKLPPELFNILGGNAQNIPPHLRIEHLLQQIQGQPAGGAANGADSSDGQHVFGGQSPGGFPFGSQPHLQGGGGGGAAPGAPRPGGGPGRHHRYAVGRELINITLFFNDIVLSLSLVRVLRRPKSVLVMVGRCIVVFGVLKNSDSLGNVLKVENPLSKYIIFSHN